LRRDKICFEILLQVKDLKVLTKERRAELNLLLEQSESQLKDQESEEDQEMQDAQLESKEEGALESKPEDEDAEKGDEQAPATKKRKKRKGLLSTHGNRSKYAQSDLSWIQNTKPNQTILDQKRQQQAEQKKARQSQPAENGNANGELVVDQSENTKNSADLFYDFLPTEQQVSLDDLYEKFSIGYYHSLDSLEADLV